MASAAASKVSDERIYLLDQADLLGGMIKEYREACLEEYLPGAQARGMKLEAIWLAPPVILDRGGNTLFLLWSFENLEAFWLGRFADIEVKGEWWARTAHMVRERKRTVMTSFMKEDDVYAAVAD